MQRSIVLLPLILFITLSASAQDSTEQTGKFRIRAIKLHPFINLQRIPKASLSESRDLASGSRLLERDLSGYEPSSGKSSYASGAVSAMIEVGRDRKDAEQRLFHSTWRLGVSLSHGTDLERSWSSSDRRTTDTLRSEESGERLYEDSSATRTLSFSHRSKKLRLRGAWILRLDASEQLSFYTGAGLTAGMSFDGRTVVRDSRTGRLSYRDEDGKAYRSERLENLGGSRESSRTSPNFTTSAFIPLGGELALGKDGFWERSHLFYEARAGWRFTRLSKGIHAQAPGIQHGLGFRFDV